MTVPAQHSAPTRYGVPEHIADVVEQLLPGRANALRRYQLRQAVAGALAWETEQRLHVSGNPAEEHVAAVQDLVRAHLGVES